MQEIVYWADLQAALSGSGLNVCLDIPTVPGSWGGTIDGKPFVLSIPPINIDGLRDWMVISLCGQDEEQVIPKLNTMMGYLPFCKYQYNDNDQISMTYEWAKDAADRILEVEKIDTACNIVRLEEGFQLPAKPTPESFYIEFTQEHLAKWEEMVTHEPLVERSGQNVAALLPFMRKVMPRLGKNQSMFGVSIISINGLLENIVEVVNFGLEPLLRANVITETEAKGIVRWFETTPVTWNSGQGEIVKEIILGKKRYRLIVDSVRNCRDLNLQVLN